MRRPGECWGVSAGSCAGSAPGAGGAVSEARGSVADASVAQVLHAWGCCAVGPCKRRRGLRLATSWQHRTLHLEDDSWRAIDQPQCGAARADRLQHQLAGDGGTDAEIASGCSVNRDQRHAVPVGPRCCDDAAELKSALHRRCFNRRFGRCDRFTEQPGQAHGAGFAVRSLGHVGRALARRQTPGGPRRRHSPPPMPMSDRHRNVPPWCAWHAAQWVTWQGWACTQGTPARLPGPLASAGQNSCRPLAAGASPLP